MAADSDAPVRAGLSSSGTPDDGNPRHLTQAEGQSAAAWQEHLFDELVRDDPIGAFGGGHLQQVLWERRIALARQYSLPGTPTLDIGCGNGVVTQAVAALRGDPVVGIDVSGECVRYASEHSRHPSAEYRHASVESYEPETTFGLVTMYEVLEHLDEPETALRRIRGWVRPSGAVILSTPNRSSLNRRIKQFPGIRRLYARLSGWTPDAIMHGHVEEYHYDELVTMVTKAGFEVEEAHGVVLLMPFPDAIARLARSRRFAELNVRSGDWCPRLAADVYLVARRPA